MPKEMEVTTEQAALFLNVSVRYLSRLLDDGKIPYRTIGTHRRMRYVDLVQYKENRQKISQDALQRLADQAQELKLGY